MYIAAAFLALLVLTLAAVALHAMPVRRSVRWMDTPLHERIAVTTYNSELDTAADAWTLTPLPTTAVSRQVLRAERRRWWFQEIRRYNPQEQRRVIKSEVRRQMRLYRTSETA